MKPASADAAFVLSVQSLHGFTSLLPTKSSLERGKTHPHEPRALSSVVVPVLLPPELGRNRAGCPRAPVPRLVPSPSSLQAELPAPGVKENHFLPFLCVDAWGETISFPPCAWMCALCFAFPVTRLPQRQAFKQHRKQDGTQTERKQGTIDCK